MKRKVFQISEPSDFSNSCSIPAAAATSAADIGRSSIVKVDDDEFQKEERRRRSQHPSRESTKGNRTTHSPRSRFNLNSNRFGSRYLVTKNGGKSKNRKPSFRLFVGEDSLSDLCFFTFIFFFDAVASTKAQTFLDLTGNRSGLTTDFVFD